MKKMILFILMIFVLASCTSLQAEESVTPVETVVPQAGLPNLASVNCEQNGYKLEIRTAADGSQSGICLFPDGNTCEEWAYFRGECGPTVPISLPTAAVETTQPTSLDDPGQSAAGGYMAPGTSEEFADWWGVIRSTPSGSEFDDYFERQDMGGAINFGIDSLDPKIKAQIEALRDSGKVVHLFGTLLSNVSDTNGSQVLIDRLEVEE